MVIEEYNQEFGGNVKALRKPLQMIIHGLMIVVGLGLLSFGAKWLSRVWSCDCPSMGYE